MSFFYNQAKADFINGTHDWSDASQDFKIALVKSTYTPDTSDVYVSAISAHEVTVAGYVGGFNGSGRKDIPNRSVTVNNPSIRSEVYGDDISWGSLSAGETIVYAVIIREFTNDSDSKLVAIISGGGLPYATNGGTVTLSWDSTGVFHIN